MTRLITCLLCTLSAFAFCEEAPAPVITAESQDPVVKIKELISATEDLLTRLKGLQELIIEYKEVEKQAIANPDNVDNLQKLVLSAKKVYDGIRECALEDYFPPQFMEELSGLAQVATKKNIPPPK